MNFGILILAGGLGSRMKSTVPKVLHNLNNKPLLKHVIDTSKLLKPDKIGIIVGKYKSIIKKTININDDLIEYISQDNPLGTGHAVICAKSFIKKYKKILILSGDVPLINIKTLENIIQNQNTTILVNEVDNPSGYGRVFINNNNVKIIEDKDCNEIEKQIKLINSGIYYFNSNELMHGLNNINNNNSQYEYYLTDVFNFINNVSIIKSENIIETFGVNTIDELNILECYNKYKIGIIGLGFVGNSIYKSLKLKNCNVKGFDIDNNKSYNQYFEVLDSNILFLCLPTLFDKNINKYDKSIIENVCENLESNNYNGYVIIKSTVEPLTTKKLCEKYNKLKFIHNPEFLTAKTAFEDFHNQKHVVLGKSINCSDEDLIYIKDFYNCYYQNLDISLCTSDESEAMKIFCNNFYSVKIQFFNELYLLCNKINCDYNIIKNMMLKNNWINPMHTTVPGTDGQLSYGGYCFPKDTNALLQFMKENNSICSILEATINERNSIRTDNTNIKE